MLDAATRQLVRSTAPVLQQHGETLTRHFYQRMFQHNPELTAVFNQGHQAAGQQQQALAMAVAAYAQHIDDPSPLLPVLERVAHKHASLGIRAEHYAIVGKHLLASIREVLGDAASDALLEAWAAAYGQLADILIRMENGLYQQAVGRNGGWSGWRSFVVARKVPESEEICSFYLQPADSGPLPDYQPGQYLTVRAWLPHLGLTQPRQYSLSAAPGGDSLRISVKREAGDATRPAGAMSNYLHDALEAGDPIDVAPPMGEFTLRRERTGPVALISAGVGITPMMAISEQLLRENADRDIRFLHACRHGGAHAFRDSVAGFADRHPRFASRIHYEHPRADDQQGLHYHRAGRIGPDDLREFACRPDADYYLCGPLPFMRQQAAALREMGVDDARIHAEAFGTGGV